MITVGQIVQIMGCREHRAILWQPHLNAAMDKFQINTAARISAFLAQVGHESGRLVYVREMWMPEKCTWQQKYEGRADLGNTQPGDGFRYRGRGLIQITGRANYEAVSKALGNYFTQYPDLLETLKYAALSAAWYWQSHGCNELADAGDFRKITRVINGGYNGYDDRLNLFERAKLALASPAAVVV